MTARSKHKVWLMLGITVLLAAGGSWTVYMLSQPSTGTRATVGTAAPRQVKPTNMPASPDAGIVTTPYFQLSLPAGFSSQGAQQVAGLLYQHSFIKPGELGSTLVSVSLKESTLAEDSAYRLRQQKTEQYQMQPLDIGAYKLIAAYDLESGGVVAFWQHQQYLATIALSTGIANPSSANQKQSTAVVRQLVEGWQWQ
jgi:hypothetical protein